MASLDDDEEEEEVYTRLNPKRHIPLESLLLWRKMVAVHCFVWHLALRLWPGSEAVRLKFKLW